MIEQIYNYFTIDVLYMWINLGVIPFWFILILFPQSHLSRYIVTTIFPFLLLSGVYIYILYRSFTVGYDFDANFSLYLVVDDLTVSKKSFPISPVPHPTSIIVNGLIPNFLRT